jgi:hypothetical protein
MIAGMVAALSTSTEIAESAEEWLRPFLIQDFPGFSEIALVQGWAIRWRGI